VTVRAQQSQDSTGIDILWAVGVWVLAAVGLIALTLAAHAAGTDPVLAFLGSSLSCAALPVALRKPIVATAMQCVAVAALSLGASEGPVAAHLTVVGICVLLIHVLVVALREKWPIALGVWWTLTGFCVLLASVGGDGIGATDQVTPLVALASSSLLALLGGLAFHQRAGIREELAAARRDAALEHERRTRVEERTRIARELHDVVAHSMSMIHMQAVSAPYRLSDLDADTRAEFTTIADGARGALGEMRQLLGVLRATDGEPEKQPAPGLARLPELVEATSRSGGPVTLVVDPDVREVPETVGTTVYRLVQEALSNVVRHAHGASATVRVSRDLSGLAVTVTNTPGSQRTVAALEDPERPRHGVTGMRERVAHLGGEFSYGPEPGGGFRVTAHLPLPTAEEPGERAG
jgi:signal transduction histidine kinase